MPIPEVEQKYLKSLGKLIGEPIPEVSDLQSYTFGYTVEDNHIVGLGLFSCGLKSLPEKINSLNSLRKLYLRGNNLKVIPEQIGYISTLDTLDLSENKLVKLPKSVYSLKSLNDLHLESNKLTIVPDTISSLTSLTFRE